jgi:hypothetical protein
MTLRLRDVTRHPGGALNFDHVADIANILALERPAEEIS